MDLKLDEALKLAKKKFKEGSSEEASHIYHDVLKRFPANKKAKSGLAALSGRPVGKSQKFLDPPQDQQQVLISLYNQGQLQQALDQAKSLLVQFPYSIFLHNICGAVCAAFNQYDAAIDSYRQALKIKPEHADTHNNMGVALKDKGKLDAAIDSYKQALKIKPDYAEARNNIGNALKEKGELDAAIDSFKQALKIKPDFSEAHNNMGNALEEKGELDAAIDSYKQALKIKPDYAEACNNIGNALQEKGELDAAIDSYKQALKIKPDLAEAASNLLKVPHGCLSEQQLDFARIFLRENSEIIKPLSKLRFMEANFLAHKKDFGPAFDKLIEANSLKFSEVREQFQNSSIRIHEHYVRISNWTPHTAKSPNEQIKKIFILGPSRSGKSSLEHILTYNQKAMTNYEAINLNYLNKLFINKNYNCKSTFENIFFKKEGNLLDLGYEAIISTNPSSLFYLDQICEIIPDSYFIFVERNELDVASEIFTKNYNKQNFHSYDPADIKQYLEMYELIKDAFLSKVSDQTLRISYEEMIKGKRYIVDKISEFMKIDFSSVEPYPQKPIKTIKSPFRTYFKNIYPLGSGLITRI
jgi:tetratricopeptide (TPR) repeat protein